MRTQKTENHPPKKVVIIGAGGFGREVAWLIERINNVAPTWQLLGFVDDDESKFSQKFYGLSVLGDIDWLNQQPDDLCVICSVGKSIIRKMIVLEHNPEISVEKVEVCPNSIEPIPDMM